jgi:hypothetical protein
LSHNTLDNWYKTNFTLVKHHGFNEETLLNKYPFERDLDVQMVMQYLKDVNERRMNQSQPSGSPAFNHDELSRMGIDPKQFAPGELDLYR